MKARSQVQFSCQSIFSDSHNELILGVCTYRRESENNRSHGTVVAGVARYFWAIMATTLCAPMCDLL